jgi:hypothetical protein
MATTYRICPRSGLQFDTDAEKLMRFHAVAGVLALLLGGIMALGVILTRWPAVTCSRPTSSTWRSPRTASTCCCSGSSSSRWPCCYFASSTLLHCRLATPKLAWAGFWLMAIGAIMTNVAIFQGESSVMFTSYVPMQAKWHFYLGLILFAVGALIGCFIFLGTLVVAKAEKTYEGSIPLVTFGALTACIIAIFTIASGAVILIPTFLWSLGYIREIDTLMYRRLVGLGPQLAADQRLRPRRDLVRHRRHRLRRQADVREGEPLGLLPLHPVPAARQRPPPAVRPGRRLRVEGGQHLVLHVLRSAGLDDPRHDGARCHRAGAAR